MRRRPVPAFALRDLPLDGRGPAYEQIYRALRAAILDGRVVAGARLPTTRALARELGLSRNTVVAAFEPLRAEGYVVTRVGAGTFVAPQVDARGAGHERRTNGSRRPGGQVPEGAPDGRRDGRRDARVGRDRLRLSRFGRALAENDPRRPYDELLSRPALPFDFRPCVPDLERLPDEGWRRALVRTANHLPSSAFDYPDPAGSIALREAIASYLARARGVRCTADEIVIVGGVSHALDLSARLFLDPGDSVLVENPHYLGARRTFEAAGARLVAAPVDAEGLDPSAVDPADARACRLAYTTPSHQFPTGVVLSLARRQELLRWAERVDGFVLEDDYDSEFRYAGRAIEAMKSLDEGGRVLYVGTFSKTLLPALRIAYLVLPPPLVALFRTARWLVDWSAPVLEQEALARFLESGEFERHLRRARTLYGASREALLGAIAASLAPFEPAIHDSGAGLHVLLRLDAVPADRLPELIARGREAGLGLYPAAPCYLSTPSTPVPSPASPKSGGGSAAAGSCSRPESGGTLPAGRPAALELVLGFSRLDGEAIREGIGRLGRLLEGLPVRSGVDSGGESGVA